MALTELRVPPEAAGTRLDAWLGDALPERSRSLVARMINTGLVEVDGRPRPKSFRLLGGERVTVGTAPPRVLEPAGAQPHIVFEDESLLVIDKPAGLVVHPAPGHRAVTMVELLERRAAGTWTPLLVHRLDRDTSGLMLVAKSEDTRAALAQQLQRGELEREYLTLVRGAPASRSGRIEASIGRDRRRRTRMSTDTDKPRGAITHFAVERTFGDFTLLRVRLETGRTHQIRVHLAEIDLPIAGDPQYGGSAVLGLDRQFLHSARLRFRHPVGDRQLEFASELPSDLVDALTRVPS